MKLLPLLALSALGLPVAGAALAATFDANAVALSLSDDGRSITTIAGAGTGKVVALSFEGGLNISLDDIDYRPATGGVFGYDDETDTVYSIDVTTGVATAEVTSPGITNSGNLGFDFNNRIDAARVVNDNQQNVVYNPNAVPNPTLTGQTALFYKAGDPNFGRDPSVNMNAYTNAVANASTTVQYVIDTGLDVLAILNNNAGDLTTVGTLFLDGQAFDAMGDGGFDILSFAEGDNSAFALLFGNGGQALYTFDLAANASGRIDLFRVADIDPAAGLLAGLTVMPSAVPVPASAFMLLGGLGLLGAAARRRRR